MKQRSTIDDPLEDSKTLADVAADRGVTPEQFIESLEPLPGWPATFNPNGHGRVTWLVAPNDAREDILPLVLKRTMTVPGLDRPAAGLLRESTRKILYIQEPDGWRQ
jgi:hypothetical protein